MTNTYAIKWLKNLKKDIGNPAHQSLWHYEQAIAEIIDLLADRKTENSSEKPNSCEDEPTDCETCLYAGECDWEPWQECPYEPKDEPKMSEKLTGSEFIEDRSNWIWVEPTSTTAIKNEPQTDCDGCKHSNTEKESDECYDYSRYYTDNYEPHADCPYIEYPCHVCDLNTDCPWK